MKRVYSAIVAAMLLMGLCATQAHADLSGPPPPPTKGGGR